MVVFPRHKLLLSLLPFLFIVSVAIIMNWRWLSGEILLAQDIKYHIIWLQHFSQQFHQEGILYPRWLAGTNYGYGSPTFVFYPPLVSYVGTLFKFMPLTLSQIMAILYILPVAIVGSSFYFFAQEKWGKLSALFGSLYLMLCPYLSLNLYSRGSLPETWGIAWIPLGVWLTSRSLVYPKYRIILTLFSGIFALTHLPTLLLSVLFWIPFILLFSRWYSWKPVLMTLGAVFLGWGLVSFYLAPAVLEQPLVNISWMKGVSGGFSANLLFAQTSPGTIMHMIRPIWKNYVVTLCVLTAIAVFVQRKHKQEWGRLGYTLGFCLVVMFLMTEGSRIIWVLFKPLQMVQFPWRALGLLSFGIAVLLTISVSGLVNKSWKSQLLLLVIGFILMYNVRGVWRIVRDAPTLNNPRWFEGEQLEELQIAIDEPFAKELRDAPEYRPLLSSGEVASVPQIGQPRVSVLEGRAEVVVEKWGSYERILQVDAAESSVIRIRTYYYPAWQLEVNGVAHPMAMGEDGTIHFQLEAGTYAVKLSYQWTDAFKLGVVISLLTVIGLTIAILNRWW
ncbi:hypothetical protein [Spirulina subsalsa]|uniref:hypothetical protein n=1 Tax=Spirulina subsalsa TaxID=54311 RepID=UPI0002DC8931|nr:hypothetical protein [Spirulina subsalsa]